MYTHIYKMCFYSSDIAKMLTSRSMLCKNLKAIFIAELLIPFRQVVSVIVYLFFHYQRGTNSFIYPCVNIRLYKGTAAAAAAESWID